jgi:nucleotide sugar dehydrogenase
VTTRPKWGKHAPDRGRHSPHREQSRASRENSGVTCVDKDAARIDELEQGRIPIFEPGLDALVAQNVQAGRLFFSADAAAAIRDAEVVLIAVGTPSRRGDGQADVSFVMDVAREIAAQLKDFTVATKSTGPVGTSDAVEAAIRSARPDAEFAVVSNPEFLREGAAIEDFKRPDRIVVGTQDENARRVMRELYRPLFINGTPILFNDRRTADLIKYAASWSWNFSETSARAGIAAFCGRATYMRMKLRCGNFPLAGERCPRIIFTLRAVGEWAEISIT